MKQQGMAIILGSLYLFLNSYAGEHTIQTNKNNTFEVSEEILKEIVECKDWKGYKGLDWRAMDMSDERNDNKKFWEENHEYRKLSGDLQVKYQRNDILAELNDPNFNPNREIAFNNPGLRGDWPLHWAIKNQDIPLIKALMNRGANPHATNCWAETPSSIINFFKNRRPAIMEEIEKLLSLK